MLEIHSYIEISTNSGHAIVRNFSDIEVVTSINDLTDTAVIKCPQGLHVRGDDNRKLSDIISEGDKIWILAHYRNLTNSYNLLFEGYITKKNTLKTPMEICCENRMAIYKKIMLNPAIFKKFDIKNFLESIDKKVMVEIPKEFKFGTVIIENRMPLATFLSNLKKKFAYFKPFFLGNKLYIISRSYHNAEAKPIILDTTRNIISHDLKLIKAEDVEVSVTATTILPDNTKLEVTVPEGKSKGTDNKQIYLGGIEDLKTLKENAVEYLKNLKSDRLTGTVTTFGEPFVRKCDLVLIKDAEHPEITNRKFVVEAVTYTVGSGGYRQKIKLGDEIK